MSFSTFDLTDLPDDAENDYAVEITTADAKLGVALSAQEMRAIADAMQRAADGDMDSWDDQHVDEVDA